jgi:hypothetical protein
VAAALADANARVTSARAHMADLEKKLQARRHHMCICSTLYRQDGVR